MARIAGVDLPRDKRVAIGLTYIFGIGNTVANRIIEQAGIDPQVRINSLTEDQVNSLRSIIETNHKVEGSLRGEVTMNVKR
ncbi:MAG: small subunit ribosomal protein S13, partial [Planctomycetota bacterium]